MEECKRCLLLESAQEDTLKAIQEHIEKIPDRMRADEALYQERLALCKQCEHLLSGMCLKCGCYVEFRAAFSKQNCPNVKMKRW